MSTAHDSAARGRNVWATPQLWWRVAIVVVCLLGLLMGDRELAFFTSQSNVLVLFYFGCTVHWMVHHRTTASPAPVLRGTVTLAILLTALVSHVLLNHGENPIPGLFVMDPADALANRGVFLMHYVVPAMVLVDWAVFGVHRVVTWRRALWWGVFPVAYGVVFIIRGVIWPTVPERYPYPFLDPTIGGWPRVVFEVLRLVLIIAVIAAVLYGIDRVAGRMTERITRRRRAITP